LKTMPYATIFGHRAFLQGSLYARIRKNALYNHLNAADLIGCATDLGFFGARYMVQEVL